MILQDLKHLLLITVIFIAACIETDIYLPAFPDMIIFFKVTEEQIQYLLSWNFIGLCVSGPFYGPLSDAFGRQKPLFVALGLFFFGSVLTVFAQTFDVMLIGRVLQGLGSGGCFTLGTAIIFDAFEEKKALDTINKINIIIPLIMAGAPLLGGYLNYQYGFRSNFLTITFFVLASLLICLFFFEETLVPSRRLPFKMRQIMHDFWRVLGNGAFIKLTLVVSLLFAVYLLFLSMTAVLFVLELGVSKPTFPFFQGALLGSYVTASLTCSPAMRKWGVLHVKKIGTMAIMIGGAGFVSAAYLWPQNPILQTAAFCPYSFGACWVMCPYFGEIMMICPDVKGIASSVLTSARLLMTAGIIGLGGVLYNGTIYPLAACVCVMTLLILSLILAYEQAQKQNQKAVVAQPL